MIPASFHDFFVSAGASGALIGLLFVAVSVSPETTIGADAPIEARATAASVLAAFSNSFFIALYSLVPGARIGIIAMVVGALGTIGSLSFAVAVQRVGARETGKRAPWILVLVAGIYALEFVEGIRLRGTAPAASGVRILAELMMVLYAIGLMRTWALLGARRVRFARAKAN